MDTVKLHPSHRLRKFNNILTAVVVALGLYIMLFPFLPHANLWISTITDNTNGVRYNGVLAQANNVNTDTLQDAPQDNRLVIPSIQVDNEVILGSDPTIVNEGVWHRPHTSTPDKGGNTVLVGHRFAYNAPATFYHLDKLAPGDRFAVWWEGTEYVYEVYDTFIVDPTAIEVEANTDQPIVTLYTCTPVWTARNRLIVKAKLANPEVLEQRNESESANASS